MNKNAFFQKTRLRQFGQSLGGNRVALRGGDGLTGEICAVAAMPARNVAQIPRARHLPTPKLEAAGPKVVHLTQPTGAELFVAAVAVADISAVVVRSK